MEHVLLVIHVIIAAALIGMVLLQRSETDGFGMGSGGGSGLISGRAQANLMTRTTAILAALFIANSLLLSILASNHRAPSIVDTIEKEQAQKIFTAPAVPNAGEDKASKAADKKAAEKVSEPEAKTLK
jgi:preprotein translocase subunit SecG